MICAPRLAGVYIAQLSLSCSPVDRSCCSRCSSSCSSSSSCCCCCTQVIFAPRLAGVYVAQLSLSYSPVDRSCCSRCSSSSSSSSNSSRCCSCYCCSCYCCSCYCCYCCCCCCCCCTQVIFAPRLAGVYVAQLSLSCSPVDRSLPVSASRLPVMVTLQAVAENPSVEVLHSALICLISVYLIQS